MLEIALRSFAFFTIFFTCFAGFAQDESKPSTATDDAHKTPEHRGPECMRVDRFFADEVWAKVGERTCLKCHNAKGDASDSKFLLRDTARDRATRDEAMRHNRLAFQQVAAATEEGKSLLLLKIAGDLDHGGGEVLKADHLVSDADVDQASDLVFELAQHHILLGQPPVGVPLHADDSVNPNRV